MDGVVGTHTDRVGGRTSQEDLAALQVDEEQDINAPEHDSIDVEEVARERAGGLGPQEL